MNTNMIVLIIAAAIWVTVEEYLIIKDRAQEKGKTAIDKRTRIFNALSLTIGITSAAIIGMIPTFQFSNNRPSIIMWIGIVIVCSGLLLRYWSIYTLGKYFRTTIEIDKKQKVIQKGPYNWIRHPSYSGIILFCIGYGLIAENWLSIIIIVTLPTIALLYRIKIEEKALINGMGKEYIAYQSKTKKLIPGIW